LYEDRYPDESDARRTHSTQGYSISKNVSDDFFAQAAEESGRWDSITLCPADNVGPIQSKHQKNMGPWQHNIEMMLDPDSTKLGGYPQNGAYRPWMTVDVRDDAACHVALLESVDIKTGERYIAWSTDTPWVEDVCASIDRVLPEINHYGGTLIEDDRTGHPDKIKPRKEEFRAIWSQCTLRNDRMQNVTGLTFRPFDESLRDCVESLIAVGDVKVKTKGSKL
jgi:hypothetical protein